MIWLAVLLVILGVVLFGVGVLKLLAVIFFAVGVVVLLFTAVEKAMRH